MVDLTSVILTERSSLWETGVGNLPAITCLSILLGDCEGDWESAYPWKDQDPRDEESA